MRSFTFNDLGIEIRVSVAPLATLGACATRDEESDVIEIVLAPDVRLGMLTTLVHEMLHAAEDVSGWGVPHEYVHAAAFGVAIALARSGQIGDVSDDEIRAFIAHAKAHDDANAAARDV